MSNKRPLILWSGGLDSTWMLWQAAQKGDVEYVTINGGQCANKQVAEAYARRRALQWIRARTKHSIIEIHCDVKLSLATMPALTWSQTVPWLVGALSVVNHARHSSLEIGYVMGDEVALIHDTLKQTWEGLQKVSKHGNPVPLNFPLAMMSKHRILDEMPTGLYECIWYCELPQRHEDPRVVFRVPCQRCTACITHMTELYRYKLRYGESREMGRYNPEPCRSKSPDIASRARPQSTSEVLYAYLPVTRAYEMGSDPESVYTLLSDQVVYTNFDKIDYLKEHDVINSHEHHILGLQFPPPFRRYLTELTPGVFSLNQAVPSELIFAVYSCYGDQLKPKAVVVDSEYNAHPVTSEENHGAARRLVQAALNDSPIEDSENARLSLHEPSSQADENDSTAQSA